MSISDDNVNILRRGREDIVGVSAVTCDSAGDTTPGNDPRVDGDSNRVYVTRNDGRTVTPAWINGKFAIGDDDTGVPVRIARNNAGEWEVIGGDSQLASIRYGAGAISKLFPRLVGELLKLVIPSKNFGPGRLQLTSDSSGLKVTLAPFWYLDSSGNLHKWRGEISGSVTLTAPGSDTQRWSLIEFDPDNDSMSVQNGTAVSITFPLNDSSDIEAFTLTPDTLPTFTVKLRTGQTAVDFESGIEDVRLWFGNSVSGGGGGSSVDYIHIQTQAAAGTDGGSASATTWHKRALTEVTDTGGHCSIASDQITLSAGTYEVEFVSHVYRVAQNKLRLRNVTDGTTILVGSSAYAGSSTTDGGASATIKGRFTIAASKALEVQHYCEQAHATNGLGVATNAGETEVYGDYVLRKVA